MVNQGVDMASGEPDGTRWVIRCGTCGLVLTEGDGQAPPNIPAEIREAMQVHQVETGVCTGQFQTARISRIRED
jgi:hypothetical protein